MKIKIKQNPHIPIDSILDAKNIEMNCAKVEYQGQTVFLTPDEFQEILDNEGVNNAEDNVR